MNNTYQQMSINIKKKQQSSKSIQVQYILVQYKQCNKWGGGHKSSVKQKVHIFLF